MDSGGVNNEWTERDRQTNRKREQNVKIVEVKSSGGGNEGEGLDGSSDIHTPSPQNSSSRPHVRVKAGPGCINNSIGRQSQTQTER